ncbi:MAG: DUF4145 domain-containing protein [Dehalococcoidia bacterium]
MFKNLYLNAIKSIRKVHSDIMPHYNVEVSEMAEMLCPSCKLRMDIHTGAQAHTVIGTCICGNCKTGTGFEIESNFLTYISGKSSYGNISLKVPSASKLLFAEAESCLHAGAPNAAAAMCRSCIEITLTQAECSGSNLKQQIETAKSANKLSDIEVGLAHASRLITNDAIHGGDLVKLADIPSMLSATVQILNRLFPSQAGA